MMITMAQKRITNSNLCVGRDRNLKPIVLQYEDDDTKDDESPTDGGDDIRHGATDEGLDREGKHQLQTS